MKTCRQTIQRNSSGILIILMFLCFTVSCNRNKLKTDEKALAQTIRTEEEQKAYEAEQQKKQEKELADSLAKLPKGFQFKEERGVDPNHPPMVIDIANSLDSIKDFSLSDVASSVEYIRMEPVPDSTLLNNMKYKYYMMDNYIVATNLYGIFLFSKDGRYIRTVVKNQMNGMSYDEKEDRITILWSDYMKIGGSTTVWSRGNDLFYTYTNTTTGQAYIMEYDCSNNSSIENFDYDPENPNKILAAGEVSVDLNFGSTPQPHRSGGHGAMSMSSDYLFSQMSIFAPDRNVTMYVAKGKYMLNIRNNNGDLITQFSKYEQVENYTKSLSRGTDNGTKYEKNGNMFYRTNFNDTVFRVIPPNRLLPVYVLNLGGYKLTMLQGKDPAFNLEGKIIPYDFADAKDYLFLTFSKDSYACPNTRRSKTLKLYHAIYSKQKKQLFIVQGDPTDYDAPILKNDIDGGTHLWPNETMIGRNGEIIVSLYGKEIKEQVNSPSFLQSEATENKKETIRRLAEKVGDEEQILMLVK